MNRKTNHRRSWVAGESGAVLVLVALLLVVILGITALAIDIGHLLVVKNQLQNAADAGALAGCRVLYTMTTGSTLVVNPGADGVALAATAMNNSDNSAVEVPVVERGHWSFTTGTFTPNSSLNPGIAPYLAGGGSFAAYDTDTNYINAVRVMSGRSAASSFFAGIFGYSSFALTAESVAWKGFARSAGPQQPFGICIEQVLDAGGNFTCLKGTMTSSNGIETAAWSNLTQPSSEGGMTPSNASSIRDLVCNPTEIADHTVTAGELMSTNNGQITSVFNPFYNCWKGTALDLNGDGNPDGMPVKPWNMTVPLIQCGDGLTAASIKPPGPENMVVGAINVDVFWVTPNGAEQFDKDLPVTYNDPTYSCSCAANDTVCHEGCWLNFLNKFNVKDSSGNPLTLTTARALYQSHMIYFKPSCIPATIGPSTPGTGTPGPPADFPRLVQ